MLSLTEKHQAQLISRLVGIVFLRPKNNPRCMEDNYE